MVDHLFVVFRSGPLRPCVLSTMSRTFYLSGEENILLKVVSFITSQTSSILPRRHGSTAGVGKLPLLPFHRQNLHVGSSWSPITCGVLFPGSCPVSYPALDLASEGTRLHFPHSGLDMRARDCLRPLLWTPSSFMFLVNLFLGRLERKAHSGLWSCLVDHCSSASQFIRLIIVSNPKMSRYQDQFNLAL